jgi:hypothetical protein
VASERDTSLFRDQPATAQGNVPYAGRSVPSSHRSPSVPVTIYAARFQPLHNGHVRDLTETLTMLCEGAILVIGVVTSATLSPASTDATGDENFDDERNPWSPVLACIAAARIAASLHARHPSVSIAPTLLPRPSRAWPAIVRMFPGPRTWVVPQRGERHDERKAHFFSQQGDAVVRINSPRGVDGFSIRTALARGDRDASRNIPDEVVDIYK